MSTSHHGSPEDLAAQRRLVDQIMGKAREEFSRGKIHKEDEGDLAFAIATDPISKTILIHFGKPVLWVGLGKDDAIRLRDLLDEKIKEIPA